MFKYNVALLCADDKHNNEFNNLSQMLNAVAPSPYVLGVNSYPHVTIAQMKLERDDPQKIAAIWDAIKDISLEFALRAHLYYWDIPNEEGLCYTGISTEIPAALMDVQRRVLGAMHPIQATNDVGEQYFPHFTLGRNALPKTGEWASLLSHQGVIWQGDIPVRLAIGRGGDGGRFEEIIYEQEPRSSMRLQIK